MQEANWVQESKVPLNRSLFESFFLCWCSFCKLYILIKLCSIQWNTIFWFWYIPFVQYYILFFFQNSLLSGWTIQIINKYDIINTQLCFSNDNEKTYVCDYHQQFTTYWYYWTVFSFLDLQMLIMFDKDVKTDKLILR